MVALQIRHVPDGTRSLLTAEAERRGQSLQGYLLDVLDREAGVINNRRLATEWASAPLVGELSGQSIADALRAGREEREQQLASLVRRD